nr:Protein of uncharacterised function (DUF2946) [Pseudomonas putida]
MSLPRDRFTRLTRPDRRRLGGGWLSLFAMWMIFIGPLVSQSMPMDHHAGMNMSTPMDMPMAAGHDHGADHHGHDDGQLHVVWEKCGYCTLLFNCPALPQALSPLSAGVVLPRPTPRTAPPGPRPAGRLPGARSRAPPASISA